MHSAFLFFFGERLQRTFTFPPFRLRRLFSEAASSKKSPSASNKNPPQHCHHTAPFHRYDVPASETKTKFVLGCVCLPAGGDGGFRLVRGKRPGVAAHRDSLRNHRRSSTVAHPHASASAGVETRGGACSRYLDPSDDAKERESPSPSPSPASQRHLQKPNQSVHGSRNQ